MPIDVDRAVEYVRSHGDEFDQVVLDDLLTEQNSLTWQILQRFFAEQRVDGGWAPFWAPGYSSLDATCYRLSQAEALGAMGAEVVPALDFIAERQQADGSFEEDLAKPDLAPPWARPGDLASRLYLTANCGFWMAHALAYFFTGYEEAASRASDYLLRYLAPDGSLSSFLQAHWLAATLWIRLAPSGTLILPDPAHRALDYLARRMNAEVPSSTLAWMLTTIAPLHTRVEHPLVECATKLLASQQRDDGSWASEDGPAYDAYITREALRALIMWRRA